MARKITKKNEILTTFLQLPPEVEVTQVIQHSPTKNEFTIHYPTPRLRTCPICGSTRCVIKDSNCKQTISHIPYNHTSYVITYDRNRLFCNNCSSSFYQTPDWILSQLRMSKMLYLRIYQDLTSPLSIRLIAKQNGLSEKTVTNVLHQIQLPKLKCLPKTLCIDEFKANSGTFDKQKHSWNVDKYHCNISDGDHGTIVEIFPKRDLTSLKKYFMQFSLYDRQQVKYLCCDMSAGFISLAKVFPNAKVCIDNFHVVQRLNKAVSDVRKRYQNYFADQGDRDSEQFLKNLRLKLTVREDRQKDKWKHHTAKNLANLKKAFELAPDLEECYNALQHFHEVNTSWPASCQIECFYEWYREYKYTEIPELKTAVKTLFTHRTYIFNSWRYQRSNAVCEGLNNTIKVLKKVSYGLHDFETFRKRILLMEGLFTIDPETLMITSKYRNGGSTL